MEVRETGIAGLAVIEPTVHTDARGFFLETWNADAYARAGIDALFVQDNHSRSHKGVLRGLHYQLPGAQGKLVRVARGRIWDVAVDLRRESATCGKWYGVELDGESARQFWIPSGFAHGFLALEDDTDVLYKCTAPYAPEHEHTLSWDDPALDIAWPTGAVDAVTVSERDRAGLPFADVPLFP